MWFQSLATRRISLPLRRKKQDGTLESGGAEIRPWWDGKVSDGDKFDFWLVVRMSLVALAVPAYAYWFFAYSMPAKAEQSRSMLYTPTAQVTGGDDDLQIGGAFGSLNNSENGIVATIEPTAAATQVPTATTEPTATATITATPSAGLVNVPILQSDYVAVAELMGLAYSYYYPDYGPPNCPLHRWTDAGCLPGSSLGADWHDYLGRAVALHPDTLISCPLGSILDVLYPDRVVGRYLVIDVCVGCNKDDRYWVDFLSAQKLLDWSYPVVARCLKNE